MHTAFHTHFVTVFQVKLFFLLNRILLLIEIQRFRPAKLIPALCKQAYVSLQRRNRMGRTGEGLVHTGKGELVRRALLRGKHTDELCWRLCFSILNRLRVSNTWTADLNREYIHFVSHLNHFSSAVSFVLFPVLFSAKLDACGFQVLRFVCVWYCMKPFRLQVCCYSDSQWQFTLTVK